MCGKTAHYAVVLPSATHLSVAEGLRDEGEDTVVTMVKGIGRLLVSAANLPIEISAGANSGCGFSLSNPREGRKLPSVRDANGEIIKADT